MDCEINTAMHQLTIVGRDRFGRDVAVFVVHLDEDVCRALETYMVRAITVAKLSPPKAGT